MSNSTNSDPIKAMAEEAQLRETMRFIEGCNNEASRQTELEKKVMSNDRDIKAFRKYIRNFVQDEVKLHGIEIRSDGGIHIDLDGAAVELYITPEGVLDVHVDQRIKEDILD